MILKRVPLPRLLKKELNSDGRTLREQGRLHCDPDITLSMQPLSTVRITVPERDPEPAMHDFVEVYNIHGSVGIYRVVDIQPEYFKGRTMTLNHALDVLHDCLYPAEEKFSGTVTAYLTALLACQKQKIGNLPYWQLGTVEDTGSWTQELSYDNILDLVKEIPETHQDFMYTYDFGTFPWTLNLVRRPDTVLTEFRAGRNIESCKVTTNDQDMCNRLYLSVTTHTGSGKTEKTNTTIEVHDDTESQQNGDFGIIENSAGIDTQQVTNKAAWIADYFERHNAPYVQISVDGNDLKEQTGVGIDEMHLGYLCRTVLPKYRTIFNERIVSVRYPSAIRTPSRVNVSMANKKQTAEDSIASARKEAAKASKSAGGTKKKADNNAATIEENTVRYNRMLEETDKRVTSTMTATGVLLDANNEPLVGPDGLYVFDTTGPGAALSSRLTQMAGRLESEITTRTSQGQTFSSRITQLSNKISLVVTGEGDNAQVSSAAIILAVNGGTGSSATINADKVNLEGYVTASTLDTRLMYFDQMIGNTGTAKTIRLTGQTGIVASGAISAGSVSSTGAVSAGSFRLTSSGGNDTVLALKAVSFGGVTQGNISLMGSGSLNTLAIPDAISALQITASGNTYTLQKKTFSSDSWTDVGSFNRAASVQISGHWSGRNYIVTATPSQLNTPVGIVYDGLVATGSVTKSGKNVSRDYIVYSDDGNGNADSIIMTKTVTISASSVYDDGYLNGRPTSGTAGGRTSGVSGYVHDFTINRAEGNAVVLAIDCSSIYSTARSGYTYGTFVQATVTPQGAQETVYVEASSGGTDYYEADLAQFYYPGDGGAFTVQGESAGTIRKCKSSGSIRIRSTTVHTRGTAIYFKSHAKTETPTGLWYSMVGSASGATTYYTDGGDKTYYESSSSGTYYYLGETDDSLYKAGTVTKYDRGTGVYVTPVKASSKKHLVSDTRYKPGTPDSTTYYTKS